MSILVQMFCFEKGGVRTEGKNEFLDLREFTSRVHHDRAMPGTQDVRPQGGLLADGLVRFGLVPVIARWSHAARSLPRQSNRRRTGSRRKGANNEICPGV